MADGRRVLGGIPAGQEKLRVHRRFFMDIQTADSQIADSEAATA
jgi:hypothetical protein